MPFGVVSCWDFPPGPTSDVSIESLQCLSAWCLVGTTDSLPRQLRCNPCLQCLSAWCLVGTKAWIGERNAAEIVSNAFRRGVLLGRDYDYAPYADSCRVSNAFRRGVLLGLMFLRCKTLVGIVVSNAFRRGVLLGPYEKSTMYKTTPSSPMPFGVVSCWDFEIYDDLADAGRLVSNAFRRGVLLGHSQQKLTTGEGNDRLQCLSAWCLVGTRWKPMLLPLVQMSPMPFGVVSCWDCRGSKVLSIKGQEVIKVGTWLGTAGCYDFWVDCSEDFF